MTSIRKTPSLGSADVPANARRQAVLASCLAVTAGYVDGYGLLVLRTFVSFMSGNTTRAGVWAGQADWGAVLSPVVAIVFFAAGSVAGNLITQSSWSHAHRILFGLVAALMIVALPFRGGDLKDIGVAALSLGMGMLNPALTHVGGESVSLTFVTGALSRAGRNLALAFKGVTAPDAKGGWDTYLYRARIEGTLWAAFALGAAFAGLMMAFAPRLALLPAVAVMVAFALSSRPPQVPGAV